MQKHKINQATGIVVIVLSLAAASAVFSGYSLPPETDEDAAAHIFQLSIVMLVPAILAFLGTADWRQPSRSMRPLTVASAVLLIAFGALFYLEHYR